MNMIAYALSRYRECFAREVIVMRIEDREDAEYVASATECTGLSPALREDGDEDARRALYAVQRARRRGRPSDDGAGRARPV